MCKQEGFEEGARLPTGLLPSMTLLSNGWWRKEKAWPPMGQPSAGKSLHVLLELVIPPAKVPGFRLV